MEAFEAYDVGSTPTSGTKKEKKCPKCGILHSKSGNYYCARCHNEYEKAYYKTHPRSINASHQKRKELLRKLIQEAKNKPCADCGQSYPYYVMDFDHQRDKKFNLSVAVSKVMSFTKVQEEIDKCDVVCANCHRIRTFANKD